MWTILESSSLAMLAHSMVPRWVGEVASLSATPDGPGNTGYNILAFHRNEDGEWKNRRIWPGGPLFMELQYPIIFPRGKGGWWRGYATMQGHQITLAEYMKHATYQFDHPPKSAALAQQFTLDMHATVQWERLTYHENQLPKKRLVHRHEVERAAAVAGGAVPAAGAGVPFHSASFTGSPSYYALHRKKALVLLARMGSPHTSSPSHATQSGQRFRQLCQQATHGGKKNSTRTL